MAVPSGTVAFKKPLIGGTLGNGGFEEGGAFGGDGGLGLHGWLVITNIDNLLKPFNLIVYHQN